MDMVVGSDVVCSHQELHHKDGFFHCEELKCDASSCWLPHPACKASTCDGSVHKNRVRAPRCTNEDTSCVPFGHARTACVNRGAQMKMFTV